MTAVRSGREPQAGRAWTPLLPVSPATCLGDALASRPEVLHYLGYRIVLLDERDLSIVTPDGRLIFAGRMALSTARNVIRGYRKGEA